MGTGEAGLNLFCRTKDFRHTRARHDRCNPLTSHRQDSTIIARQVRQMVIEKEGRVGRDAVH